MEYFPGTLYNRTESEVLALAQAAKESGKWLFTDINEINIIADPQPVDPEYPDQLVWTYKAVFPREKRTIIGQRAFYQNLIPEMQALAHTLQKDFAGLDITNHTALIQWLHKLVPVTWCEWALPDAQLKKLGRQLPMSPHVPLQQAKPLLQNGYSLSAQWHYTTSTWLQAAL